MQEGVKKIQTQLGFNKATGEWYGEPAVLDTIDRITGTLGIMYYELYHKSLKEYLKNRDIYDMSHNRTRLLRARIVGLTMSCKWGTEDPINKWLDEELVSNSLAAVVDHSLMAEHFHRGYPMFPLAYYKEVEKLMGLVRGYLNIGDAERSKVNLQFCFTKPQMARHIMLFYSDWERYTKDPGKWANKVINTLLQLDYGQYQDVAVKTITRKAQELSDEGVCLEVSPTRHMLKVKSFWDKVISKF